MNKVRELLQLMFAWIFTRLACVAIRRHQPTIVAITGNVGKTTTKDIMMAVLKTGRTVGGTIRSQNSDLTTPLTTLGLEVRSKERRISVWCTLMLKGAVHAFFSKSFPEILVLEVGAGSPGDITRVAKWLKPHVAVYTALQRTPVHLDYFNDRQHLFDEKKELAKFTQPTGTIVYNSDDEFLPALLADFSHHTITVGYSGQVQIGSVRNTERGTECTLRVRGVEHQAVIPRVWGESYVRSLGLSVAVAVDLGLDVSEAIDNFYKHFMPNPGRMRILRGIHNSIIIDDSYNASPIAVRAALDTLKHVHARGRKIFLFGDMKELAGYSTQEHKLVGTQAGEVADVLYTVGQESKHAHKTAIEAGLEKRYIKHFLNANTAGEYIAKKLEPGDILLAKSSRHAIKMEQALRYIVEPEEIGSLVQEYL